MLARRLVDAVAAHAEADPLEPGLPMRAATRALELPEPRLLATSTQAKDGYDVTLRVEQTGAAYHFLTAVELVSAKGSKLERVIFAVRGTDAVEAFRRALS